MDQSVCQDVQSTSRQRIHNKMVHFKIDNEIEHNNSLNHDHHELDPQDNKKQILNQLYSSNTPKYKNTYQRVQNKLIQKAEQSQQLSCYNPESQYDIDFEGDIGFLDTLKRNVKLVDAQDDNKKIQSRKSQRTWYIKLASILTGDIVKRQMKLKKQSKYLFKLEHRYIRILTLIFFVSLAIQQILLPFEIAFGGSNQFELVLSRDKLKRMSIQSRILNLYQYYMLIIYYANVVVELNTQIYDDQVDNLINDRKVIITSYFQSIFFLVDLAILPYDFKTQTLRNLLMILRISKVFQKIGYQRQLYLLSRSGDIQQSKIFLDRIMDTINISSNVSQFMFHIVIFVLLNHLFACIFYMISINEKQLDQQQMKNLDWYLENEPYKVPWNLKFYPQESNIFDIYLSLYYFILQTAVTTGYGDLAGATSNEQIFQIFLMFISCFMNQIIVGQVTSIIQNSYAKISVYEKKTVSLSILKKKYGIIDQTLVKNIEKQLEFQVFKKENAVSNNQFFENLLWNEKKELLNLMYKDDIEQIEFFRMLDQDILIEMIQKKIEPKYKCNEYVFQQNDVVMNVYFIKKGEIKITSYEYNSNQFVHICTLNQGQMFGGSDIFLKNAKRKYSAQASKQSELISINAKDFLQLMTMRFDDGSFSAASYVLNLESDLNQNLRKHLRSTKKAQLNVLLFASSFARMKINIKKRLRQSSIDSISSNLKSPQKNAFNTTVVENKKNAFNTTVVEKKKKKDSDDEENQQLDQKSVTALKDISDQLKQQRKKAIEQLNRQSLSIYYLNEKSKQIYELIDKMVGYIKYCNKSNRSMENLQLDQKFLRQSIAQRPQEI